jgi:hypothetical protein
MAPHKTITINGRQYDAVTGMPIEKATETAAAAPKTQSRTKKSAGTVHATVQRSKTLHRRAAKKPATPAKTSTRPTPGRHMDIARSPKVTHFAPHPTPKTPAAPAKVETPDVPAKEHPVVAKALAKAPKRVAPAARKPVAAAKPATAKEVKEAAITKAINAPKAAKKAKKSIWASKWTKRLIGVAIVAIVLGGTGYIVYKFVPSVSVSIAAAQAGIEATYPEYTPDGFSLEQPVTYSDGQVDLTFASNSNSTAYTITQKRSSWDSTAVLDNVVKSVAGDDYSTTRERGLTIYTYGNNAAWVNSGILYTIKSDAALSGEQIRRLATSL